MRLIDADAMIIALAKDRSALVNNHVQHGEICRVDETIWKVVDAPTIAAAPVVRGEWGFRSNGHNITRIGDYEEWHECSVCKLSADYPSSYCPNCGAKMEDKQ